MPLHKHINVSALVLCLLAMGHYAAAQVTPPAALPNYTQVNYIREWTATASIKDTTGFSTRPFKEVKQTTQYFDGLGRPLQTVAKQVSPSGKDMVLPYIYDAVGREVYKYLPFVADSVRTDDAMSDGNFKSNAFQQQDAFSQSQYPDQRFYYGQNNYEASPLNRIQSTMAPGDSWVGAGRGVNQQYLINDLPDSVCIWTITAAVGSLPATAGMYPSGGLYKSLTADEAGHQVVEYKDMQGKVILKKVQLWNTPAAGHSGWLNTYYIYDEMDNLRFVIQPKGVEWLMANSWSFSGSTGATVAYEFCFRYEYDGRNRMVIKKVPGAGETWMIYDARDRIVMTQDSALRRQFRWWAMLYDSLNRVDTTVVFNDALHSKDRLYHQNLAASSVSYPNIHLYPNILEVVNYYDDYSWPGAAPSMALSAASQSKLISNYNTAPDYAVAPTAYMIVQGLPTGKKVQVLNGSDSYMLSTIFYDDHGRVIQTRAANYTGAYDTLTTQYNFSGLPLRILLNHQKNKNTVQHHDVLTKMSYDAGQRLKYIWKNIDGAPADQLIDSLQYDELEQVKAKFLGNALDSQIYEYNIRGWLTSINKNYLKGTAAHYFGMELGYDKPIAAMPGTSYANLQYTGNIAGTIWKAAGDGIGRKYDFSYDNINRLTGAAFTQNSSSTAWDSSSVNYSVSNLKYDANGNILSMNQSGLKGLNSAQIDQLVYSYLPNSNKLRRVDDGMNDALSTLGDFHAGSFKTAGDDYGYDGNGSMTHDNNKGIDSITYNQFNLPTLVHMNGKGNIAYTYDGEGNKLAKITTDSISRRITTTIYTPGGFVYQRSDTITNPTGGIDTLQFAGHEEGRARWAFHRYLNGTTGYKWEYDFFEKDHLGNTRTVLTQQKDTAQYVATMEAAYRNTENALFYNIPASNVSSYSINAASGPNPFGTGITNPNDSVCRLDGNTNREGPAIILKVMAGDLYRINAQSFWKSGQTSTGTVDAVTDILSSLANGIVSMAGGSKGSYSSLSNTSTSPLLGGVNSFRNDNNPTPPSNPKAYLNYIALDNQFNYDASASGALGVGAADALQTPGTDTIRIKKNGYLYIYLLNETKNVSVFFDNLSVTHYCGPLLEETHYYPSGLAMQGISDRALKSNYAQNKYKYNGKELQNKEFADGTGLEEYDFGARMQDPQLMVWHNIDPLADQNRRWSPYVYANDNPIRYIDPDGMETIDGSAGALTACEPCQVHHDPADHFHEEDRGFEDDKRPRYIAGNASGSTPPDIFYWDQNGNLIRRERQAGPDENWRVDQGADGSWNGIHRMDAAPSGGWALGVQPVTGPASSPASIMKGALSLAGTIAIGGGGGLDLGADGVAGVVLIGGALAAGADLLWNSLSNQLSPGLSFPPYPGNDPTVPPGEGWQWKGAPGSAPGSSNGSWTHPDNGSLYPNLDHPEPIGPHWDWKAPDGSKWRGYPDGTWEWKKPR